MVTKAVEPPDNPAKFSDSVLAAIVPLMDTERERLGREPRFLDPFAGVGKVHLLGPKGVGVEIEHEWAEQHPHNITGDSRFLKNLLGRKRFDMEITSCTYATRMADHHNAQERCKACDASGRIGRKKCEKCDGKGHREYRRHTYRHYLGRELTPGNSGGMQWGDAYRALHEEVWAQMPMFLSPGGLFVLNISNHYRKGKLIDVVGWHRRTILKQGVWTLEKTIRVKTQRLRHGQNHELRAVHELIYAFRLVA